jgi:hypothetical protein
VEVRLAAGFLGVKVKLGLPDGAEDVRRVAAVRAAIDGGHYVLHVIPVDLELDSEGVLRTGPSADAQREREMMLELKQAAELA